MRISTILGLCALFASLGASAESFYKWKDEQGVWHYDAKAPKGQQTTPVDVSPTAGVSTPLEDSDATKDQKERDARCKLAQNQLKTYESYTTMTQQNADGTVHELSEAERKTVVRRAREQAESDCAKPK